jgi:predicted DNA-binding transcriptional regulator AlpA
MTRKLAAAPVAYADVLIDARYIASSGLFKSESAVYRAEANGLIPKAIKVGVARRWRLSKWRAFISNGEVEAAA